MHSIVAEIAYVDASYSYGHPMLGELTRCSTDASQTLGRAGRQAQQAMAPIPGAETTAQSPVRGGGSSRGLLLSPKKERSSPKGSKARPARPYQVAKARGKQPLGSQNEEKTRPEEDGPTSRSTKARQAESAEAAAPVPETELAANPATVKTAPSSKASQSRVHPQSRVEQGHLEPLWGTNPLRVRRTLFAARRGQGTRRPRLLDGLARPGGGGGAAGGRGGMGPGAGRRGRPAHSRRLQPGR